MSREGACPDCATYLAANSNIVGACASVGIEHGKTTDVMVREYMSAIHREQRHVA